MSDDLTNNLKLLIKALEAVARLGLRYRFTLTDVGRETFLWEASFGSKGSARDENPAQAILLAAAAVED